MFIKYDSTHGTIKGSVKVVDESTLEINGKSILQLPAKVCVWMMQLFCGCLSIPLLSWGGRCNG
ncbi:putative glyceraldehyde-3-phosphate dehydrogenase (phosphorylating) [Dioscorea sansibarensis]